MKAEDWIHVVDRMPGNSRLVLAHTDKGYTTVARFCNDEWVARGLGPIYGVTYWMDIVKPIVD